MGRHSGVSRPSTRFGTDGLTARDPGRNVSGTVLRLLTFGGLNLVRDDGSAAPRVGPPRLALLAALAAAGERGVSRDRLLGFFWPDSDDMHGRHSLRQALYILRREIGRDVVQSHEAVIALDDSAISSDVAAFRAALAADDLERAVGLAQGAFLDAFYLPGAPAFERWVEVERARLTVAVTGALGALATAATGRGDRDAVVEWCRQLTVVDPLSGGFAVRYLEALAARGDRAGALAFIRRHEALVRRELDAEPDPAVRRIETRLRAQLSTEVVAPKPKIAQADGSTTSTMTTVPTAPAASAPNAELGAAMRGMPRRRVAWMAAGAVLFGVVTMAALVSRASPLTAPEQRSQVGANRVSAKQPHTILRGGSVAEATTSSPVAQRLYQEGLRAYARFNATAAQQLMRAALKEDSTFATK